MARNPTLRILLWNDDKRLKTLRNVRRRLRGALKAVEAPLLSGIVEVDETLYGPNRGEPGRSKTKATAVAGVEILPPKDGKKQRPGALRILQIPGPDSNSLLKFIEDGIEAGATVRTDGAAGYYPLRRHGYDWQPTVLGSPSAASSMHPWVHVMFRNLKMVLNATHAGIEHKHIGRYLKAFEFRFNHRGFLGSAFGNALGAGVRSSPITYSTMIG